MSSNPLLHFITKIIKFEGFKATNYHFITENELFIELENKENLSTCPHCHKTTDKVHQSHRYRVRDIRFSSFDIFLGVNRRQFNSPSGEAGGRRQEAGGKILVNNQAFLPRPTGFKSPAKIFNLAVFG
jgi:hypothetical protein